MIKRALAALLSILVAYSSIPARVFAADIVESPMGIGPRTPGGSPIVSAPQLPAGTKIPALPISTIEGASLEAGANASLTPSAAAAGVTAGAEGVLASAEAAVAAASLTKAAAPSAQAAAAQAIPAAQGKFAAAGTGRASEKAQVSRGVVSRVVGGLKSLKLWGNKAISDDSIAASESANTAPLAKSASQGKDEKGVPAPQQPGDNDDGGKKGGRSWFGLGGAAASFIGALLIAQVGVEALGASMPTLVQKVFGDFTAVAQLAIFSSVASIVGRQMAPVFIKKYGLKKVYLAAEAARVVSIGAMVAMLILSASSPASFIAQHMLSAMMISYSINGALGGVAGTAESSIPPAIVGQDNDKLERFWSVEQTLLETIGVSGPIITGMVVSHFGFVPALVAYPVALAASIVMLLMTLRIPKKVEAMRLADLEKAKADGKSMSFGSIFKEFFARIARGTRLVWKTPSLKYAFLAYTAYMALNPFLYSMIAPAYALRLVGDPQIATSIGGWLTGLYSAGGLLGGVIMMLEQKKLDKAEKAGTMSAEQKAEYMRKSLLKWLKWGTVGLLAIGTLAFKSPIFLGGLTIPALALIPFGVAQVISVVKLKSYFQSKAPQKEMADAMGFHGAASLAVSTAGLLGLKYLFKGFTGFSPFWYLALAMIPLAAYYVYLTARMAKVSKPDTK